MAAEPFTLTASLAMPPDSGQPNEIISHNFTGTFTAAIQQKFELNGTGTRVVNFGPVSTDTTSGARVVWLEYERPATGPAFPIRVAINGGTPITIGAGGFMAWSNPPGFLSSGSITSLSIDFSTTCTVRVALLGSNQA